MTEAAAYQLILLSHGATMGGAKSTYAGWRDVDLSLQGAEEARLAGTVLKDCGLSFQVVFASVLRRSVRTTWLACMELPSYAMPVITTWRLNDRHYGTLQELPGHDIAARHGQQTLDELSSSINATPPMLEARDPRHPANDPLYRDVPTICLPGAESWCDVAERVAACWNDNIYQVVASGASVLLSAHRETLASLCWHLAGRSDSRIEDLRALMHPGIPLACELDDKLRYLRVRPLIDPGLFMSRIAANNAVVMEGLRRAEDQYDVVILGGGPCGLRAAEEAGARGKRAAIIDTKDALNGAPTGAHSKCLREAVLNGATTWEEVQKVLEAAAANTQHRAARTLRTFQVKFLCGRGVIAGLNKVEVTPAQGDPIVISTDAIVIATGSKSNRFPPTDFSLPGVYDSDTIWSIKRVPEHLVVQGAGIISVEYALIFAKLGSKVTIIDAFSTFLPMLDVSVQEECRRTLEQNDVEIIKDTPFTSVKEAKESTAQAPIIVIDAGERTFKCDALLAACGRHGNTKGIGLETLTAHGLKISDRGGLIEVNACGYTGAGRVYAVGDCATGSMGLATMGMAQAVRAVRDLFSVSGLARTEKGVDVKPFAIWTIPEVAWAGVTEEQAVNNSLDFNAVRVDFCLTARGCVTDEDGFMKLIYDKGSGRVLGVHICGPGACELVNFGAELINTNTTVFDLLHFVFPAVTYHVLYNKAATEAKLRKTGAKKLAAATGWKQLAELVEKDLGEGKEGVVAALQRAFEPLDPHHSGIIAKPQLDAVMENLGLSRERTKDVLSRMVTEATGDDEEEENIDYITFLEMLESHCHGSQQLQSPVRRTLSASKTVPLPEQMATFSRQNSPSEESFDLVVLGGGPAGLRAAMEAGARGKKVALIEPKETVLGIPTGAHSKCLREAALGGATTWQEVAAVLDCAAGNAEAEASRQLRAFHVTVFTGKGKLKGLKKCEVLLSNGDTAAPMRLDFGACIIATGSRSNRFPPTDYSLPGVYDSDTIWSIDRVPKALVVQGSGIIGIEYALIFAKLGCKVILVDAFPAFLPMLDVTLQERCRLTLAENDVELLLSTPFKSVTAREGSTPEMPSLLIDLGDRILECDMLLSACGRSGNVQDLGLEALESEGLRVNPRGKVIAVDKNGYTGAGHIYAVGDCAEGSMGLATMGQMQAVRAVRDLYSVSGLQSTEKQSEVKPFAIWTIPEIAWAGMTEEKAKEAKLNYHSVIVEFSSTVRGCLTGESGLLKMIYDRGSGKVLGVHLFGQGATELVNFGAKAVNENTTIYELLHFVFPAVTYHELYHYAAAQAKVSHRGIQNLAAATAWTHLREAVAGLATNGVSVDEKLQRVFMCIDRSGSGFVSKDELKEAVTALGLNPADEDIDGMVVEATGDAESENVDYESFLGMLQVRGRSSSSLTYKKP